MVGAPDVLKGTCPVRGALGGNLLLQGSKAPSFDSIGAALGRTAIDINNVSGHEWMPCPYPHKA